MIRKTALLFLFLSATTAGGQIRTNISRAGLDSMIGSTRELRGPALADRLNLIATSVSQRYPDSCCYYANKALLLSVYMNYSPGIADAVFNIGNRYFYKMDVKNATVSYLEALRLYERLAPSRELGNLLMQIGYINRYVENHLQAVAYFRRAGAVFKGLDDHYGYANALYFQGYSYIHAELYDSAFYYSSKAIASFKKYRYFPELSKSYNGYGIVYLWRDDKREENERFEGPFAIPYFDSALMTSSLVDYKTFDGDYLLNMAESYHHYMFPQQRQVAEKLYHQSIRAGYEVLDYSTIASGQALLGELYADEKKPYQAKIYLDSSLLSISRFISQVDTIVYERASRKYFELSYLYWTKSFAYRGYYKLYKTIGAYDSAIYYYQLMVKTLVLLRQQRTRNQIAYLLANAENERTNRQIELLEKGKDVQESKVRKSMMFLAGSGVIVVLIISFAFLFVRQNKLKNKQETMALQEKLRRSQMNPHFIFNSLSSIQHLVVHGNPEEASVYLARFSTLIRNILNSSIRETIPLETELKTIDSYLALQSLRYKNKFDHTIKVDPAIDTENLEIPVMMLQPFIENAIEHGIRHKDGRGHIRITFTLERAMIMAEIEDDGIGRQKSMEIVRKQNRDHLSLATSITHERIRILNRNAKYKITLEILDLKNTAGEATGTRVVLRIPFTAMEVK